MILSTLLAAVVVAGASVSTVPDATYRLPFDHSAVRPDGHPLYVSDAKIAAAIPGYAALGERIGSCLSGMTVPQMLQVVYPPTVTGPHAALSNALECELAEDGKTLACRPQLAAAQVVFDVDPRHYFTLGAQTGLMDALDVYRAYREGGIAFADPGVPHFKSLPVSEISVEGDLFLIRTGDCGCSETLEIERKPEFDGGFSGRTRSAICA